MVEKENMMKNINQMIKKIDYMKQFKVLCKRFRTDK